MPSLPQPSAEALQHSHQLTRLIQQEIADHNGWISFARFMELALYAPGSGYYSAGSAKFGQTGDFVTAPEISSLFGRTLARQVAQILQLVGGNILEAGAGSGRLALQLLCELERLGNLPAQYFILEVSADLQQRQQATFREQAPHLLNRIVWLSALPATFNGIILGNEVLDAMPVHLLSWQTNGVHERGVMYQENAFVWRDQPLAQGKLLDVASEIQVPPGYVSEVNLAARGFIASLAHALQHGIILMIDYGFGASEYYHPQRTQGTLMCHYRHYAHAEPFYLPGLQDITAHVDFSAIALAGIDNGLQLMGYTTQASFLLNCGITDVLAQTPAENAGAYLPLANQAQKLLSPAEMGELFKVIALGKGISDGLSGFVTGDKSRLL